MFRRVAELCHAEHCGKQSVLQSRCTRQHYTDEQAAQPRSGHKLQGPVDGVHGTPAGREEQEREGHTVLAGEGRRSHGTRYLRVIIIQMQLVV